MVKNNETAAQKKKKRRRKTRDMRDKMSKLAKLNGESGSGGSGNEESDKSKKAKKQRSLERKERSLLKQKKRLMRLTEKAQKSGGEMTGQVWPRFFKSAFAQIFHTLKFWHAKLKASIFEPSTNLHISRDIEYSSKADNSARRFSNITL